MKLPLPALREVLDDLNKETCNDDCARGMIKALGKVLISFFLSQGTGEREWMKDLRIFFETLDTDTGDSLNDAADALKAAIDDYEMEFCMLL